MTKSTRFFAIVPAAGKSRRMGRPKLLLPTSSKQAAPLLIDRVLSTWIQSKASAVIVVVDKSDDQLVAQCKKHQCQVAYVEDTPDMKATILAGINFLVSKYQPDRRDWVLIAPADLPDLKGSLIDAVCDWIETHPEETLIVPAFALSTESKWEDGIESTNSVDTQGGELKRGHPIAIRGDWLNKLAELPDDRGLDALFEQFPFATIPFPANAYASDLDTPSDYQRFIEETPADKN